jgi:integrase
MATKIDTKTARDALKARREPYWHKLSTGLHIGYRRPALGEGTWIARRTEGTKKTYQSLGQFFDIEKPKRKAFDDARAAAAQWAGQADAGVELYGMTVEAACRAYVDAKRSEKGDSTADDANGRFGRLVYGRAFGAVRLDKLTTTRVRAWRDAQLPKDPDDEEETRRAKDSTNRNLATLKAALNLALSDRLVATDAGWKTVTKFREVGRKRELFLTREQRDDLIQACPGNLRALVKGLTLTALRPGELAACKVKDFDRGAGTLNIRKSKTDARIVPLSTAARAFFSEQVRTRIAGSPLLPDDFGKHWNKDAWKKPFKASVTAAKLPTETVTYSLRHAAISELLVSGMDMHTVAKIAGTSTDMIDEHYGHLCIERTRHQLDAAALG